MKAIKVASGVAVSALALAISAQANAAAHEGGDTEFSMSATGSMEAIYMIDLSGTDANGDDATVMDVELDEGDDFDSATAGEAWGLQYDVAVTHGPFSGTVSAYIDDGETTFEIVDLIVTDGPISFGQIGSLLTTDDYAYDMDDSTAYEALGDLHDGASIDAGLRYTMGDLKVQIDGTNDTATTTNDTYGSDFGGSFAYAGSADALSFVVDGQFRGSNQAPDTSDAYTYVGAGATYTADMFTAKAAFNTYTTSTSAAQAATGEKESISEYGFELSATPMDAVTAYLKGQDLDAGNSNDTMLLLVGATYTVDTLTFKGEYENTAADGGDSALFNVSYKQDKIGAYGEVTMNDLDGDGETPYLEAGVNYTQDNGVRYAADWDFQSEGDFNAEMHTIKLGAAYAF